MTPERDRSDGRRAIFSAPGGAARPAGARPTRSRGEGRQALFSAPEEPPGVLAVECSGCGARTPVGLLELGRHLVPSLWLPFRRHPRLMRCPACGRAAWCRIAARR
jgi:hypothetical protein